MFRRSTLDVPFFEKLNHLHDVCRQALVGFEVRPLDIDNYDFEMSGAVLGELSALRLRSAPCIVTRTVEHAVDPSDSVIIQSVISGEIRVEQGGNVALLRPGDTVVHSAELSSSFTIPHNHEVAVVKIPRKALMLTADLPAITGRNLSEAKHIGPIVHAFVGHLTEHAASISNWQVERLVSNLADLVVAAADSLSPSATPQYFDRRLATLERVKTFIRNNLGDHDLTPAKVSQVSKLSNRYLNRLLEREGTSIARFIWDQRIEKAAKDLADPRMRARQIADIAFCAGFRNVSHFSTAFRDRFEISPREYREILFTQNAKAGHASIRIGGK